MARGLRAAVVVLGGLICLWALVWEALPLLLLRGGLLAFGLGVVALVVWREVLWRRQTGDLANDLCDTVDALMEGKGFPAVQTYEDSVTAKVQGKLLQYYEKMADGQRQSTEDKQTFVRRYIGNVATKYQRTRNPLPHPDDAANAALEGIDVSKEENIRVLKNEARKWFADCINECADC